MSISRSLSLKVETTGETLTIVNIEEYAIGFFYIFVKTTENVLAIDRDIVLKLFRLKKEDWVPVELKKVPKS